MPSRYRRDAARLKAEIVARVEAGETLGAICASPGLPAKDAVRTWAKDDAASGEALSAARRRAAWRRLWAFDEAKAQAFLARARAGQPVKSLVGRPGMPSRETYRRWKIAHPPFAEAAFALRQGRDARARAWGLARRRDFDRALADRIVVRMNKGLKLEDILAADPELPGSVTLARWRREQPEFDAVLRRIFAARRGGRRLRSCRSRWSRRWWTTSSKAARSRASAGCRGAVAGQAAPLDARPQLRRGRGAGVRVPRGVVRGSDPDDRRGLTGGTGGTQHRAPETPAGAAAPPAGDAETKKAWVPAFAGMSGEPGRSLPRSLLPLWEKVAREAGRMWGRKSSQLHLS
ncbi:MAG: hypothetical protein JWP28_3155 [Phenylobacterium sp.]|uniref:terminase small subunit-like protein n=1 Tax=Phenylobacterium sp. TaxID=1871053 RepID=UPI002610C482|nr:hypothetical protein [Phenylobacterium sp.]MDB5499124.1 hypothetical protein [Phenylobacterium sp.]